MQSEQTMRAVLKRVDGSEKILRLLLDRLHDLGQDITVTLVG